MKLLLIIVSLFLSNNLFAAEQSLSQLLADIKKTQRQERSLNNTREAEFLAEKHNQQKLLTAAKAELATQDKRSHQLKSNLQANEELLSQLETKLKDRSGVLGELFGVARQTSGDLSAELSQSLISAQYPNRAEDLKKLTNSKALPSIEQLENLWFTLQHEMTESAKVVRYKGQIETAGLREMAEITRIGSFNAIAKGGYLRYSPESNILVSLARQPNSQYLNLIEDFSTANSGLETLAIDPTRGVMLSLLIQSPNTSERIDQGGIIGYIILSLGAIGLILALFRLFVLLQTGQKMQQQISQATANNDNPLGRVLLATEQTNEQNTDTLELILDEAITREVPALEKGLSLIKLFAAVAPLLGLLGTVTGMIATFQSISLFGTGDPKLMADGISQALVTTMLGLCVAIPLLFLYNLVASRSKVLIQILDEQSAGIMSRRAGN
ncbi:MAG: MotA/TolQ/ExbB proton channel family protein [Methyloprofundus sp.]|nr:MotA/TolQ/ExbB proton channel family protein [Methyloprofundus sp.]